MATATLSRSVRLRCELITRGAQLEELAPAWAELQAESQSTEPMMSPTWLIAWWRCYGEASSRELRLACFYDGEHLVGLVPLLAQRHWYRPGIPFRRLQFLGREEVCSEYLQVLAARGFEDCVLAAFAGALASRALGPWDELVLDAMDGTDFILPGLQESLAGRGYSTSLEEIDRAPYIDLPASWEQYLKGRSSAQRYFINRSLRDFDKWAAGHVVFHDACSSSELEAGKEILTSLHTERWREAGQTGAFHSPRFTAFHNVVLPQLFKAGNVELLWLSVNGRPIAAAYNIIWNRKLYFYQSGRSLDVPNQIRPGVILHANAIRRAIEAGQKEYDFLGDPVQYKMQMATGTRSLVRFRAFPSSAREAMRRCAETGITQLRRVRSVFGRRT